MTGLFFYSIVINRIKIGHVKILKESSKGDGFGIVCLWSFIEV